MRYVASGLESGDLMFNSRHHRRHRGGPMGGRKFRASANVKTFLSTLLLTELSILVVAFLLPFPLSVPFFSLYNGTLCARKLQAFIWSIVHS